MAGKPLMTRKDAAKFMALQAALPMVPPGLIRRKIMKDKARRAMNGPDVVPPMGGGLQITQRDIGIAIIGGLAGAFFGKMFK